MAGSFHSTCKERVQNQASVRAGQLKLGWTICVFLFSNNLLNQQQQQQVFLFSFVAGL
jgi:hypothetical protein